jgi:tetratricopeptide (TPR) repeat protein
VQHNGPSVCWNGKGKKREAVAACEKLTANPVVVHDAIYGKRPSSIPYLIEACHRELLSLLSDEDQKQLQNCEFPLSPANIFKLYYMLNEYSLALKYYTNKTQSPDMIEMKMSCLRLAGNELVEMDRGDKSYLYFTQFLAMLQTKEGFLDKPFHTQCETLAGYAFANQYYIFRSLGTMMAFERGNLDGGIQCYERCLELDEDLTLDQSLVARLAELYQLKALTVDIENQDSWKRQMNLALDLFQKLLQKNAKLTPFVECSFGLLLSKLERYHEAVEHFESVIRRENKIFILYTDVEKPLFDVYLRREIDVSGSITIPLRVRAFYELILTHMKLNEVAKAQRVALRLENDVERLRGVPEAYLALSIVGYANKLIGNKEKAAKIFVSVLEIIPGHLCTTMVRVFVEMGKKREAVAACEKLTTNPVVVHDAIDGKRPSSMPYLIEACHRELLSLLSDEDQQQLQNFEFPLSPANIFKLYYMLNEYTLALKYYTNETQSPEMIEMKISCLCLAGNEFVEMDRGNESELYFMQFLRMLQTKDGFLDKPFHAQCATLAGYSFANQYYIFRSLGKIMESQRGNLDGVVQCYERCLELDEDLTLDQNLVATLAELYQLKALTVDIENQDSCKRQMNLALDLFQKLLQTTAELTPSLEWSFGSLLLKLERYHEAVKHFENVIKGADDELVVSVMECTVVDKPLFDVYLRREIEARGSIIIAVKVVAFYELILTYMKLNEVGKAQEVALRLEKYVERFQRTPNNSLDLSIVGYANKRIGNKEKAAEIFVSVLEIIPGHLCSTMVRVFVEMGTKKEAVAACEKLTTNPVVVHDAIDGKRPSSMPYLIEACHRELLSLLSDEDQQQLQNCEFPLSPANIFNLYYMLNEYTLALKYYTNETESPDLIEMKISCLRLAGNELVEMDRGNESHSYFTQFLAMLQTKEGFLDKPFHTQCATLAGYFFANQYYIFFSLGWIMASQRGDLDGAIQCYERCLELDEALTLGQGLVATLADLYQSKALTVDIENQDSCKRQMNLALDLFQKLLQKTAELAPFVECSFGSLLLKLERYHEAVEHFQNVIKRADDELLVYRDIGKPLFDVYLRREIEASGSITIPVKVRAFYELILTYLKLNEVGKAQEVALRLENYVERFQRIPETYLALSIVGYANKLIGNKEKAAEIFVSVLEIIPGHLCSTVLRVFVEMRKKREAVAACEKLTANPVVFHDAIHGKRPSSMPCLIEACHRELLSLLSDEEQKQLQNFEFPLSPANIFKLYYMLNEYTLALKYYTNETQSPDLIEMKISCLCLAGNELVKMDRGDESHSYFAKFFAMLQFKEGFLHKPFHAQCATLTRYSFANQYYIFRSLGIIMALERGILDGGIQCLERCLELDEDLTHDQNLVAILAELYQLKALTVDRENQDSCKRQMNLALDLFQKLLQKTAELIPFVECSFGSLLLKLERYHEAVKHLKNVIERAGHPVTLYTDAVKPLFDVYLRREIETSGSITIPVKVRAFYELILTYMKLNEVGKTQEVALQLEDYVKRFPRIPETSLTLSIVGYANKLIGNKEKASEIFVSVLEINPGHLPVTEALESLCV